jgi:L-amino acid N-acyltransferase YncA
VKLLIDTNVIVASEPTDSANVEATTAATSQLLGLIAAQRQEVYVHPASLQEIAGDRDEQRRSTRLQLVQKYVALPAPPRLSVGLCQMLGRPASGSHDEVDLLMLSAIAADAVDFLVTNDRGVHRRAARVGLADRVLGISDAILLLRELAPKQLTEFPAVSKILCHELDHEDAFFDSLRRSYGHDQFNAWIRRAKREHRPAYRIAVGDDLAGLAVLKEGDTEPLLQHLGRVAKICMFKIADGHRGKRLGELLLKPTFEHCLTGEFDAAFCTCFPKERELIAFLRRFGFVVAGRTAIDEIVLVKRFTPTAQERHTLDPLTYHVRFGPARIKLGDAKGYVVPIVPDWHRALFPELDRQMELFAGETPYGNSILKAYLCKSNVTRINPGSVLMFYRSGDRQSVQGIGVAEQSLRSRDPDTIIRFVGTRTVYTAGEIQEMAASSNRGILAILFRQARSIDAVRLAELVASGVVTAHPQSISQVARQEGVEWMRNTIEA